MLYQLLFNKNSKMKFTPFLLFLVIPFFFNQNSSPSKKDNSSDITERIAAFAELYGIVRYFHPSDEATAVDWNKFAEYGVDLIQNTETEEEFSNEMKELFSLVAPSISFTGEDYEWEKDTLKNIFWSHFGLGLNSISTTYKSVRINKDTEEKFYAVGKSLKKLNLKSTRIKFKYQTKSEGLAYGYIKVIDANGEKLFFKNHRDNTVFSSDWEQREIITPKFDNIGRINIGGITKRGKSTFRNFQVFYEKRNGKWGEINLPAYTDKSWYPIKNAVLTKNEKVIIVDRAANSVQPASDFYRYKTDAENEISVPLIVYDDNGNTVPASDSTAVNNLKSLLENYEAKHSNTSCIANVIITWNIFRHFYPYQEEVKVDWKKELNIALVGAMKVENRVDELATLQKMTEIIDDGHSRIISDMRGDTVILNRLFNMPISLKYIDDDLVVSKVPDSISLVKSGDVITHIDGVKTQTYMDSVQQYISGSQQHKKYRSLLKGFLGKKGSEVDLTLMSGRKMSFKRTVYIYDDYAFYTRPPIQKDTIKIIENDILYLNMDVLTQEQVTANLDEIQSYSKIIMDVRGYPASGNNELLKLFFSSRNEYSEFHVPTFYEPNFENVKWVLRGWKKPERQKLNAEIVLLADERSISYAESTTSYLKHNDYITFIGRPTAGANGNVNKVTLNDDFTVVFTGFKVNNPDGSTFHNIGVIPDILVKETIASVKEGRDVCMEEAVNFLKKK